MPNWRLKNLCATSPKPWPEDEIEAIFQERYLHVKLTLIGIYHIADSLEGIERDTYRQSDRLQGEVGAEHLVDYIANDEIGIFEIAQQSQVYKHHEGEQRKRNTAQTYKDMGRFDTLDIMLQGIGSSPVSGARTHPGNTGELMTVLVGITSQSQT